jgi:Transposase IS116/IS110/IS902 family
VEAIRALVVAKRSARSAKIQAPGQIRHLSFTAPDGLRQRLAGVSRHHLAARAAGLRPATGEGADPVVAATKTALRILGRRVLALDAEKARIGALLAGLVTQTAPQLLAVFGAGVDTAAALLVTAGDNAGRLRSEAAWAHLCGTAPLPASSGKVTRYRPGRWPGPTGQLRPAGDRDHPAGQRPPHAGLHGPPPGRGPVQARGDQGPGSLRGPGGLPPPAPALTPPILAAGLAR